ncbi:hypothetical protein LTR70_009071 [Exophiala xenobiotica]|uniref:NRPS protein n=1 Tax=Lithohypha guttulata TaxID=1690604 RepID=A0ABR0K8J2_9EURO|nr:NRPS protein [Lithohypha guttulata]KAK5311023.1 hypothetical protein LTR70_009071 [Exophiala xenobiotica]
MSASNAQSSTEPRLAIANPNRQALPGPEFLDRLVSSSAGEDDAIVYLNYEGDISTITYSLLDQLSSKLAHQIQQHLKDITTHHEIVPVILPQHPALYVAYLAVLKCGAAFCPVTPDTPEERLSFIVEDVDAKLILCFSEQRQDLERMLQSVVFLSVDLLALSHEDRPSLESRCEQRRSTDIAYVMYTSGSTGKPKGVPISHYAVTQSLLAHDEHIPSFNRFLQFAAPTFDVSLFEIFFSWYRGCTMICCERERLLSDLPGIINQLHVDAVELTPTVATTLLRERSAVPGLRALLTIGEMLTSQVIKEFGGGEDRESMLVAMYGPTEAAIHCTIAPRMSASSTVRNIGQPLSTVTAFILEEQARSPIPKILRVDQIGELGIAGQLANGYLHRQEQTDTAFVELPGHGIVYRTGDRAVMTSEGNLHILGRISGGQVKLRGQRVELGEVEEAASHTQGVDLAVAVVVHETLVLFCSGDTALQTTEIEQRCKAWLPRHMRPGDIVILAEGLPRLPSGKIDRKRLEVQYRERQSGSQKVTFPAASEAGFDIVAMISDELHAKIDMHSSLRSCGLDSLRAIRLASRLRGRYPNASLSMVLEAHTVDDLLSVLDTGKPSMGSTPELASIPFNSPRWQTLVKSVIQQFQGQIDPLHFDDILPCTPIQIAMLSETSREPGQNVNEIVIQVDPSVSLSRLTEAFEILARDNAILRAGFVATADPNIPFVHVVKHTSAFNRTHSLLFPLKLVPNADQHVIHVVIHHALYDGWSWDLILRDINTLLKGGGLRPRPSFQDFVLARQAQANSHNDPDLMAWTDCFQQAEPCAFPVLQSSSSAKDGTAQHASTLSIHPQSLSDLAEELNISKPSILHAALSLLLGNLLDTTCVISGLVVAGRDAVMPEVEEVIGPCLSTLPLQLQLDECNTTHDIMLHTYREHMRCLRHSSVSLAQIKSALRMTSDDKLFDVVFVWQESLYPQNNIDDLAFTSESHDHLKYTLVVEVEPGDTSLRINTTYNRSNIPKEQIVNIHAQLDYLTSTLISHSKQQLNEIWQDSPIHVLSVSNVKPSQPSNEDLIATIARTARAYPDRTAVDFIVDFDSATRSSQRQTLSYQDLHKRAQMAARSLVFEQGLVTDDIVLICCAKSVNVYILICATIMAGCAYLCVEPNTPDSRLQEIIEQATPSLLVFDGLQNLESRNVPHAAMRTLDSMVEHEGTSDGRLPSTTSGSDLAYAVFTSGSTGVPKGVLITRQNLMSNIEYLATVYPHSTASRLLQSCSLAFDVSVFEIFWTWHCGMTLCSANNDVLFRDVEKLIDCMDVTHLSMTPSVAALVNPNKVPKVQFLVCAGEPMSAKVYEAWADHGLHQGYGPSETTNICNVRSYVDGKSPINNVGPSFPNTTVFVCSRLSARQRAAPLEVAHFSILPQGAVGEIWLGGLQVGRGYTDPDLTCRSWLDHPQHGRLYRSGDIGRLLADGSLVVLRREDDQAKIRGQRIELNEINFKFMQSELVADAFTLILCDTSTRDKLVSFWVPSTQSGQDESNAVALLFERLHDTLPAYMIPECLIPVQALPLTRQGKVDKRALADVHVRLTHDQLATYSGPLSSGEGHYDMTDEEAEAVKIVSEVSGVPASDIKIHASFFTYGIDSIRAIPLAQKLRHSGYHAIQVSDIMKYSSIKRLLAHIPLDTIETGNPRNSGVAANSIPARLTESLQAQYDHSAYKIQTVLPCTPLQEAMLSSGSTNSSSYLNHLRYRLVIDPERIRTAWSRVVERQALLRTVFALTEEPELPYVQIVLEHFNLPWIEVVKPASEKVADPFDKPPYSLQIIETPGRDAELHLFMHHALYDAEALNNLHTEVEAFCVGEQLPPAVPFSKYLDFMVNAVTEEGDRFWQRHLKHMRPCRLSSRVKQKESSTRTTTTLRETSCLSHQALRSCAKSIATTMIAILQASLARLLSAYFRTSDVCFGTIFSGRHIEVSGIDRSIGPCFNTLPVRCGIKSNAISSDLCQNLQQFNIDVLPLQATALRRLQKQYSPDGRSLFDVLLLLQSSDPSLDDKVWQLIDEEGQMDFPFIVEVFLEPESDQIHVKLHTAQTYDKAFTRKLLSDFCVTLENTVNYPHKLALDLREIKSPIAEVKTDGHTMPEANGHASGQAKKKSIKQTPVAQAVLAALRSLGIHDTSMINAQTNIFQLGLDSINAVQLASRLRSDGYQVTVGAILEEPRIQAIVELCETRQSGQRTVAALDQGYELAEFDRKHRQKILEALDLRRDRIEAVYPCTATQSGILSEFSRSEGRLYYNCLRLRLTADIDHEQMQRAWTKIIMRHALLRTGFAETTDPRCPFAMVIYKDHGSDGPPLLLANERRPSALRDLQDITRPPWSIHVHKADGYLMDLHILHALYDAHSLQHVLRDFEGLYHGERLSNSPSIVKALSTIISLNQSDLNNDFWLRVKETVQPTRFPDLNIMREIPSRFCAISRVIAHSSSKVQQSCERRACSLLAACQVAWARLLAAYTGQRTVVFGSILSGRVFEEDELNDVVLPCINTLPVIVDLSADLDQMLENVQIYNSQLQKNPHIPLSKIKNMLGIQGDLFDTVLVLQKYSRKDQPSKLWDMVSDEATAEYAVSLEIVPHSDSIELKLAYDQKALPVEHSGILLKQYEQMLYEALDPEHKDVGNDLLHASLPPRLPMIDTIHSCLHDLALSSAAQNPDKIALEFVTNIENGEIIKQTHTYRQLESKATQVAHMLIQQDIRVGDFVAVCFEKCAEASFAILGVLMAGCAYVAIDPGAPIARKHFILEDSKCNIVLTTSAIASSFDEATARAVNMDELAMFWEQSLKPPKLSRLVTGDDICYCLYTSGTTGTPKGCLISHRSIVQAMLCFSRIFDGHWTPQSRWLQFAGYHFDVSVLEHFWTWKEGLCVTVAPRDLLFEDLPGTINKLGITHLDLTPSLARLLTPDSVPSLCEGVFIIGGEQVRQDIINTWGDAGCLYNFYGPSEVTPGCTVHPRVKKLVKPANIGQQWDNVGSHVLEPGSEKPVLIGAVGELCLSGVLVGEGYLNRPGLTAEKFVTLESTGQRIYRTGDLVRMLHDHSFEYLSRIDDQVKLRGQRLEIGEINHVLSQCSPDFADAATIVARHPEQDKEQLVTFLARAKETQTWNKKPSIAADRLPAYMVPTYFIAVRSLPLTVNNKVDAKLLRSFYESTDLQDVRHQQESTASVSHGTQAQLRRLTELVANYLEVDQAAIEPMASLLQLGIDSISAIGLSRALRTAGYTNASVALIMKRPILMDLAEAVSEEKKPGTQNDMQKARDRIQAFAVEHKPAICRSLKVSNQDVHHIAPCTPLQEGMISKMVSSDAEQPPYLTHFVYRLNSSVNLARLSTAWDSLQTQFGILRTRFVSTEDGYAQVVLAQPSKAINSDYENGSLEDDPSGAIGDRFKRWRQDAKQLGSQMPWQVWLTQRESGRVKLMSLFIFHGIYDGISIPLLLDALYELYDHPEQSVLNAPLFHEALPHGPLLRKDDAPNFWRGHLPNIRLLNLRNQGTWTAVDVRAVHCELHLDNARQQCSALAVTAQALFHAAWLCTLAEHLHINPTVGIVLSGRSIELENADRVVGPMFNTLPFSINGLPKGATFADLVKACHRSNVDAIPYQHTALSDIKRWIKLKANQELFDSLFVYQGLTEIREQAPKWTWTEQQSTSISDYPLNIEIAEMTKNTYSMTIVAVNFVEEDLAEKLVQSMREALGNIGDSDSVSMPPAFFANSIAGVSQQTSSMIDMDVDGETFMWTEQARTIRRELAELAGVDEDGIDHNHPTIFELGLDSVEALKLVARLKNRGIRLPVSKIMQKPTVGGLTQAWVAQRGANSPADSKSSGVVEEDWKTILADQGVDVSRFEAVFPVTPIQEGLLVEFEKYFHVLVYELLSGVDVGRFTNAVHQATQNIPTLRTSFITLDDSVDGVTFLQAVSKAPTGSRKPQISYRFDDMNELKVHLSSIKENASLDDSTPSQQIAILENNKAYYTLAMSHAHYDAWSLKYLLDHITRSYHADVTIAVSIQPMVQYEYDMRQAATASSTEAFWLQQCDSVSPTLVTSNQLASVFPPTSSAKSSDRSTRFESRLTRTTSRVKLDHFHQACRTHGVTMQSLGLTAWGLTLVYITRQLDTNFGLVVSGRMSEETERLVFPTFNTVMFRPRMDMESETNKLLQDVHDLAVKIFEHQHFPLSNALRLAHAAGSGLFNTLFTFQRSPQLSSDMSSILKELELGDEHISPPFAVNIEMEESEEGLCLTIALQEGVMSHDQADEILQTLDHILEFLVTPDESQIFALMDERAVSVCALPAVELLEGQNLQRRVVAMPDDEHGIQVDLWSDTEKKIASAFSKASGINEAQISKQTSLFHLGLDSVSAIRVSKLLREAGLRVPVSVIIRYQTADRIAANVQQRTGQDTQASEASAEQSVTNSTLSKQLDRPLLNASIRTDSVEAVLPATAGQVYMLDMWKASRGRLFYATFWLEILRCNHDTLEAAFENLVEEAPALRTRFMSHDGKLFQVVFKPGTQKTGPLQYEVAEHDDRLLIALHMHHALYDAVSLDIILQELRNLCQGVEARPSLNTNFVPYIELADSNRAQASRFWKNYLRHSTPSRVHGPHGMFEAERTELFVPELLPTADLESIARREGISMQAMLFAVVARIQAKARLTSPQSIRSTGSTTIGIYLANRSLDLDGIIDLVAPTFNVVPLKVSISGSSREDILSSAKEVQRDLEEIGRPENCGVSLREIHAWTSVTLDCYVNFLKLPRQDDQTVEQSGDDGLRVDKGVTVRHAEGEMRDLAKELLEGKGEAKTISPYIEGAMEDKQVEEWCLPALDVEAKVDGTGHLAVGMFVPEDMFSGGDVQEMMNEVKAMLEGLTEDNK